MYKVFTLLVSFSLFAQSASSLAAALGGSPILFPIELTQRGPDYLKWFSLLTSPPYKIGSSQIAIQTTLNGLLINIQSITTTTNSTIFIIGYMPQNTVIYVVVPVEQIVEMVYSNVPFNSNTNYNFGTTITTGTIPFFPINLPLRASDIVNAFNILNTNSTNSTFKKSSSQVAIQTNLTGTFYSPLTNGLISNIQAISTSGSPNNSLLLITYRPSNQNVYILVAPEQITQIIYTQS